MKILLTIICILFILSTKAQTRAENEKAIISACNDYIDAFYKADTTLAYRSVHPKLQKRGFAWSKQNKAYSGQLEMPFPALVKLAKVWNADGNAANSSSPHEVTLLDMEDQTASAKVTAVWGIDYIHLTKQKDGRWMVMNVLWQSLPVEK